MGSKDNEYRDITWGKKVVRGEKNSNFEIKREISPT